MHSSDRNKIQGDRSLSYLLSNHAHWQAGVVERKRARWDTTMKEV
jgi:hypothetical protein